MALDFKVGTFAERLLTGSQAYTGVGFLPKAMIFYGNGHGTADGTAAHARAYVGFATGTSERVAASFESRDGLPTTDTNRAFETAAAVNVNSAIAGQTALADFTSLDADGFTLNWISVSGSARLHNYIALGGDDITNVKAGSFTSGASPGAQAITGVGFQPDCVLLIGTFQTTTGISAHALWAMGGFVRTTGEQWSVSYADDDAEATASDSNRRQRTDKCFSLLTVNGGTAMEGTFVSCEADGFTINWSTASARLVGYLAIKGGAFKLGSFDSSTSTGAQAISSVGFEPKGVMLASFGNAANTATQTHARLSVGAANSATSRAAIWAGSTDAAADSIADSALSQTVAITMQTEGTPTEIARADLTTLDSGGFTLDWEVADATARQVLYAAFGDSIAGGGGGTTRPPGGLLRLFIG